MTVVAMAWIGQATSGHGSAICVECGWCDRDQIYGRLAMRALAHDERHSSKERAHEAPQSSTGAEAMSTYSSSTELGDLWEGPYGIDVAHDSMGKGVRILLDGRSAYLDPDDARRVATALNVAADETDAWAAEWKAGRA